MNTREPVVYRYAFKCDVCGFEEAAEVRRKNAKDPIPEPTLQRDWKNIESRSFVADYIDVCSRECAEKHAADFLDSVFAR